MNERINSKDEIEIDLLELLYVLKSRMLIIIVSMIICGIVAVGYTKLCVQPMYSSTSIMYILTQSTSLTSLADIQLGTQLTSDYVQLIKSRSVLEQVIDNLNLDYKYDELGELITVTNPDNTRILEVTVNATEPKAAKQIVDELSEVSRNKISDIMSTDAPNIVQKGYVSNDPVNVHLLKNTILGILIGFVLSGGAVISVYLIDDTITTEDDIEKYLEINTLASIPLSESTNKPFSNNRKMHNKESSKKGERYNVK